MDRPHGWYHRIQRKKWGRFRGSNPDFEIFGSTPGGGKVEQGGAIDGFTVTSIMDQKTTPGGKVEQGGATVGFTEGMAQFRRNDGRFSAQKFPWTRRGGESTPFFALNPMVPFLGPIH